MRSSVSYSSAFFCQSSADQTEAMCSKDKSSKRHWSLRSSSVASLAFSYSARLLRFVERPAEEPSFFFFLPLFPRGSRNGGDRGDNKYGGGGLSPTPDALVGASFSGVGAAEGPIWPLERAVTLSAESSSLHRVLARAMNSALEIIVRAMISTNKQKI